jgi:hypothetical protein
VEVQLLPVADKEVVQRLSVVERPQQPHQLEVVVHLSLDLATDYRDLSKSIV